MPIITLTTDMGTKDHYVASIKGTILSILPELNIIDISHEIKPFNIAEAAFNLICCYQNFPKGSVHIIGVDSEPVINLSGENGSFPCILKYDGHYFISNDNGFFGAFLSNKQPEGIWRIDDVLSNPKLFQFPAKNIFAPIACKIIKGEDINNIGSTIGKYKKAFYHVATVEKDLIKGNVIHIDIFGNLIVNISKDLFEHIGKNNPFTIFFRSKDYFIEQISSSYNEVSEGERVAIFNENNLLEIAINKGANGSGGGANKLFGVNIGDIVRIEFTPRGSRETIDSLF
ncbi:MAG: SAM hydrolase/SAM-dependent halogenase family protein [Crocinitomicaceae bacterium]